jgi:hypothetical protein
MGEASESDLGCHARGEGSYFCTMKILLSFSIILCSCAENPYIAEHNRLVAYYMAHPIEAHAAANVEPPDFTNELNVMNDTTTINNQALEAVSGEYCWY